MKRLILHLDVNNAFLAWTALSLIEKGHTDIRKEVSVIGSFSSRGVILSRSNLAKEKKINSGEPMYMAKSKYPNLKVYEPDFRVYHHYSEALFNLIKKYVKEVEIYSIDECFIDLTTYNNLYNDPYLFAQNLAKEIKDDLGFTVNIGIANNKLCAKMASDFSKPDKIHTLYDEEVNVKMWPLAIEKLFFVGKKSSTLLRELGINTIGDLAAYDEEVLYKYFKNRAKEMINHARGIDCERVNYELSHSKGISNATTLVNDTNDLDKILDVIRMISENLSFQLRKEKIMAKQISINYRDSNFKNYSKQMTLHNATFLPDDIYNNASTLFKSLWKKEYLRLIGVSVTKFTDKDNYQISFLEEPTKRDESEKILKTIDEINKKYGKKVVSKAKNKSNLSKQKNMI